MSRPIKFRIWGFGLKPPRYRMPDSLELYGAMTLGEALDQFTNSTNWAIEQFTGLLDSKGVEIYEGDILLASEARFERTLLDDSGGAPVYLVDQTKPLPAPDLPFFKGVVEWGEARYVIRVHWCRPDWLQPGSIDLCTSYAYEVIGNIHEHSHLLS